MLRTDLLDSIPFPAMVTTNDDLIVSYNQEIARFFTQTLDKNEKFSNVFLIMERYTDEGLMTASIQGVHFLFFETLIKDTGNRILIGQETKKFVSLEKEIKKLHKLNQEMDAIIENSYDGIYITDVDGITLKTNSAIERITGIPKEYYIGKPVRSLVKRGVLQKSVSEVVLQKKRTVSLVQKNYAGKETLLTGSPIFNDHGEIEKVVTNIRDLSDLNELHEELRKQKELNNQYREEINRLKSSSQVAEGIVTNSDAMGRIYDTAERIADIDATVLILGETGVGKDVLVNFIYAKSTRAKKGQLVKVNCGAIPSELLESELFGYESGAFTGAHRSGKKGMFEQADGGILFLDEIGEMPLKLQVKLLRVLQDEEITRVGGTVPRKVNTKIIAATNRDVFKMVEEGEFREDLYYRLNVISFQIPALRERKADIIPFIQVFLDRFNKKYKMDKQLDYQLQEFLYHYHWPGNIRELQNLMERLVVMTPEKHVTIEHLPQEYHRKEWNSNTLTEIIPLKAAVESTERQVLSLAVEKYNSTYKIAAALEISQPTVVRKLNKYGLS